MNFKLKDLVVTILVILGMLGSINWLEIPFWIYILFLISYAGLRLSYHDEDEF